MSNSKRRLSVAGPALRPDLMIFISGCYWLVRHLSPVRVPYRRRLSAARDITVKAALLLSSGDMVEPIGIEPMT